MERSFRIFDKREVLIAVAILFLPFFSISQTVFTINGKLKVEGGDLRGATIVIDKNGHKEKTIPAGNGVFSIPLLFNNQYQLSFEKEGCVTKKLSFDTHAPAEGIEDGYHEFDFTVSLFKQYDDVNIVVFNQPVGMIKYYEEIDDFDYDTDYTKSIRSRLQKALEQVEKAKEEEEKKEKLAAKEKKVEDAKAKAELKEKKEQERTEKARSEEEASIALLKAEEEERKTADAKIAAANLEEEQKRSREKENNKERERLNATARMEKRMLAQAQFHEGSDVRVSIPVQEGFENSPIRMAKTVEAVEEPVLVDLIEEIYRAEELIIEENKVITRITLENGQLADRYQKVVHKFGATFYFKNGHSCSQLIYEQETLADN